MNTCSSCRHWQPYCYVDAHNPPKIPRGECRSPDRRIPDMIRDAAGNGFLITEADFGCVAHRAESPADEFRSVPTGRLRMLLGPKGTGRLQQEWTAWFGGNVWLDVPTERVAETSPWS